MSIYYCESCQSEQNEYINTGSLPIVLPGQPNVGFNIGSGFSTTNGYDYAQILVIQIQSDGKILVGGIFDEYSGTSVGSSLIRLESDGTIDTTFDVGTGFNFFGDPGYIYSIQIQSDGKILVGGYFDEYNGTSVGSGLIRLESDGTIDTTFDVGTGFNNGEVRSISLQSDGKILVGGQFDEYSETSVGSGLIRLESDGTIDTTFDVGTGFYIALYSSLGSTQSIQIQSDGKILVGGYFDEYSGTSVGSGLIRLESDGTVDTSFDVGTGFLYSDVRSISLQSDGKILVGGVFDEYSGTSVGSSLIRLESDGTIDTTFDVGTGFNSDIASILLQSDGKILVGGGFDEYNGTSVGSGLIRLESDGTIDTTFDVGSGFDGNAFINSIQIQSDGKILVGGYFNFYNGFSSHMICQIEQNVTPTTIYAANFECYTPLVKVSGNINPLFSIGNGFGGNVNTITLQPDGKILVGGQFTSYSGVSKNGIIRLNSDYTIDNSFVIGSGFRFGGYDGGGVVYSIQLQSDGKILVGGFFDEYSGTSVGYCLIRLESDGSIDNSFVVGLGLTSLYNYNSPTVKKIQIKSDGKILVGGFFDKYNGEYYKNVVTLNNDGSVDESFYNNTGFNSSVNDITLQPDGKILFGGNFTQWNGYNAGDLNILFTPSTIPSQVNTSLKDINNDILFGFGNGIGKVDPISGSTIFSAETDNTVNSLEELSDSSILVGGGFTTYSGITTYGLAKINSLGYKDSSFNIGDGFGGNILTTKELSDGKILVGGNFTKYGIEQVISSFNLGIVGSSTPGVRTMIEQPDGKFIIAGQFTSYGGSGNNKIVRLNTDGSKDNTFFIGSGFGTTTNSISQIYLQTDGKVLCVGSFTTYQGINRNRINRLNTNGSEDSSFIIGTGFNGTTNTIALQSDGKILVGGAFTTYSGLTRNRIIRLNTNGSVDTSFVIGTGFGSVVSVTTLQSDGKILAGGSFTSYSGLTRNRIIRLDTDGSTDTSFVIGTGFDNTVLTISLQSDGKILVGGSFTLYSGVSRNRIIRLNTNGSVDTSFVIGTGFNGTVNNITLRSDGKILVGGDFTSYSGVSINRSILLNTDGSIDLSFSMTGSTGVANSIVFGFLPKSSFTFVFGNFTTYNEISQTFLTKIFYTYTGPGTPFGRYSRLNSNGSLDLTFSAGTGFTNTVNKIDTQSDGKILVAGTFTQYSGISTNKIVRLNTDNTLDTTFNTINTFNGDINNFDIQSDGKILVGGSFTGLQYPSNTPSTFSSTVNDSVVQSDGKIIVVGNFSAYSGVTRNRIVRLNTDYTIDNSFVIGTGFNSTVNTVRLQSDGQILVGGQFSSYSGVSSTRIIRLNTDGSIDNSFVIGTGFDNTVLTISLQSDGKILVGGSFTLYNGSSINRTVRLNPNGSIDPTFNTGYAFNGSVNNINIQPDGSILFGGTFTSFNEYSIGDLNINFNPSPISTQVNTSLKDSNGDIIFGFGYGMRKVDPISGSTIYEVTTNNTVNSLEVLSGSSILVGGNFTTYSSTTTNGLVKVGSYGEIDNSFNIGVGFNNPILTTKQQLDGKILVGGEFNIFGETQVDRSFNGGFNGSVYGMVEQSDGKILVGGFFQSYSGSSRNRIIRLNTDGSIDDSFVIGTGFNNGVSAITLQSDGKILVGGSFTSYSGLTRNRIIRLNTDGSIDTSFIIGIGFNNFVNTITLQPDGKIIVGGSFTSYSGVSRNNIIRLNTDGSVDTSFVIGDGFNYLNSVQTISLQPDGKILVGGLFTQYSGVFRNNIIRLNTDGSVDTSFVIGTGFSSLVNTIALQSDGKILVGGAFLSYSGVSRNKIIRLNTDGSIDSSFVNGDGFDVGVQTISLRSDGKILVGGDFTSYSGVSINRSILLNTDGSIDLSFSLTGSTGGANGNVRGFLPKSGFTYVYGDFTTYNSSSLPYLSKITYEYLPGTPFGRYSRLNSDGSLDLTFSAGTGFNSTVNKIDTQSDGKILVAGAFTQYSGISTNKIVRLNTNNTLDTTFNDLTLLNGQINSFDIQSDGKIIVGGSFTKRLPYFYNKLNGIVSTIVLQSDGKILLGGYFGEYNGVSKNGIVRLNTDYTIDTSFVNGDGFDVGVQLIELQSDGKILVGGGFSSYSGVSSNGIIRLNTDGLVDTTFNVGTGFNGTVYSIALQSDGKILVGGYFDEYSGTSVGSSLIRLESDGTIDTTFDVGTGFNLFGNINSIQIQSDGKILVGGSFDEYSGTSVGVGLIRLESDGTIDTTFDVGSGFNSDITSILLQSDGKILVGGGFDEYNGTSVGVGLIRLESDGTIDTTFDVGTGFDGLVYSIKLQPDGKILVGGEFTSYSGVSSYGIIRLSTGGNVLTQSFGFFNGGVFTIALKSDGNILVGGNFTTYDSEPSNFIASLTNNFIYGESYNRIGRYNTNGTIDTTFSAETGFNDTVTDVSILPDGKIFVSGSFSSYSGITSNRLARINPDGSYDTTFVVNPGFNISTFTITQISSDYVLVGGNFTLYDNKSTTRLAQLNLQSNSGISANNIIRLNNDGSVDNNFVIGTGFTGSSSNVTSITLQPNGKILVGGNFTSYNGVSRNDIIRLNTDGSVDTSFVIGSGFAGIINIITLQSDGKILVGGSFSSYSGVSSNNIIRINTDGSVDTSFVIGTGFNGTVWSIALQSDGKILTGGFFTSYNDLSVGRFAVILPDGNLNGVYSCKRIARLDSDGNFDNTFVASNSFNGVVTDVSILTDGKILVSGGFTAYGTTSSGRIARLNSDGSYDSTFVSNFGFGSSAYTITQVSSDYVSVGGNFTYYNGIPTTRLVQLYLQSDPITYSNRIVRLNPDGTNDTTFDVGTGFSSTVIAITLQSDGKILVGGAFSSYSGVSSNNIIRLNTDGSIDTSFVIGTGFDGAVLSIALQPDGKILVGGQFSSYSGELIIGMTRLNPNGSIDNTFDIGTGFNDLVNTIQLQGEDRILVGGNFNSVDDFYAPRFTSLVTNQPNVEIEGSLLFDNCEICNSFILSSNTEYIECLFCNGDALLVDAPHPVWSNNYGRAVTQLDAVTIGGNGWNS
jgi:uncharacterized delta-60 repeat protein